MLNESKSQIKESQRVSKHYDHDCRSLSPEGEYTLDAEQLNTENLTKLGVLKKFSNLHVPIA